MSAPPPTRARPAHGRRQGPRRTVRLVLMFAISPDGRAVFRDVLDRLTELLSTPNHVRRLLENSSDYQEFVHELVDLVSN